MPVAIAVLMGIALVKKYGPQAAAFVKMGIKIGKALAEGRNELTDAEWAEVVIEGDAEGQDFRELVGRE